MAPPVEPEPPELRAERVFRLVLRSRFNALPSPRPNRPLRRLRPYWSMQAYRLQLRHILESEGQIKPQEFLWSLVPHGLYCPDCELVPRHPVTGACGHPRCCACVERHQLCPCGEPTPENLAPDVSVMQLVEQYFGMTFPWGSASTNRNKRKNSTTAMLPVPIDGSSGSGGGNSVAVAHGAPAANNSEEDEDIIQRWMRSGDLTCVLCTDIYSRPVTTPCGHTFCRYCIEKALGYRWACPLCKESLEFWDMDVTKDNWFVSRAVRVTGLMVPCDKYVENVTQLPLFVCTVAYPKVPCPLLVFEPRYRLMIKRCLLSKSKRFGMVHPDLVRGYVDYGTILEIRDCLRLPTGRFLLSTMGVARFRVNERDTLDGYDVATYSIIEDEDEISTLMWHDFFSANRGLHQMVRDWMQRMNCLVMDEAVTTYGDMPAVIDSEVWSPDGPSWIWWALAVLPLSPDIKLLILSSPYRWKRLRSVMHTVQLVQSNRVVNRTYFENLRMNSPSRINVHTEDNQQPFNA